MMPKSKLQLHFKSLLLYGMIGIIFLHMGISDFISARELKKEITSSVDDDNELIAEAVSDKLIEMFKSPIDELIVILNTIEHKNDYKQGFDEGIKITKDMRNFDRLILVDESENVQKVWPYDSYVLGMDQSGTGYKNILVNNPKSFWSSTYVNYTNGKISIDLIMPLKSGYIVGTIYLEELSDMISSLKNKPGTIVAITDSNNTYLAHNNPEKVSQRARDNYLIEKTLNPQSEAKYEVKVDGQLMRPFIKKLETYNWSVIVYYPVSLYDKPVRNLVAKIIIVQIISLAFIILILLYGSNYLNKLLNSILGFTKSIEIGNYNIQAPDVVLSEFKEVIESFEHMATKIKHRENEILDKSNEIQKMNEELEIKIKERTVDLELANQNLTHTMENLIETQEKLIQQEKLSSLGSLVEGIAHEINTPLGICITTSSFIENEVNIALQAAQNEKVTLRQIKEFLETIQESGHILSTSLKQTGELVENFKNITVEQKSFSMIDATVSDIISAVFMELNYDIHDSKFNINVQPNKLKIFCFPEDIVLILFNLVRNAIIHGLKDTLHGTVTIDVRQQNKDIILSVIDTGKGIDEQYIKRIFDPFFTTQRGNSLGSGRGLGLYIVYNLIEKRYKGKIYCESSINKGTTFTVNIPNCVITEEIND